MLSIPDGLTDAQRTVFYRRVALNAELHDCATYATRSAAARSTLRGSSPNSAW
ncbi:hypothetical protein EDF31_11822 [Curtobacterium sp. PhB142]|nr:hypothetical protein EDF31_11822 [Curtobacterium sp. PhB142]TCL98429.1 hypothetical protein EDF26_11922 [Curtobacterium sp. PhB134]TCU42702.1 hypothetical protein EDF33_11224 [Curtobacterium sp. PhB146]TDW38451.1 hypothetical protein EDF52_1243 [Curtobacterium sp. PhB42]TDW48458.1 hypothetical protein EDF47_1213 [Curtobacterium sp. PhB190]TDW63466.1 hypothetical protein EDF51_1243 [Curtobacterium sp. PhB25]